MSERLAMLDKLKTRVEKSMASLPGSPTVEAEGVTDPKITNAITSELDTPNNDSQDFDRDVATLQLHVDEPSSGTHHHFCPVLAVSKLPYQWLAKPKSKESEALADKFFNQGKFWQRSWDLFYAWPLSKVKAPVVFIRYAQLDKLLCEIKSELPHIKIPLNFFYEEGLVVDFGPFSLRTRLYPQYLGRCSTSREDFNTMVDQSPEPVWDGEEELRKADEWERKQHEIVMEKAAAAAASRTKALRQRKINDKLSKQAVMTSQLKRAQQYLGLRLAATQLVAAVASIAITSTGIHAPVVDTARIDVNKPAASQFVRRPVFISVDVEAWEFDTKCITEVGISTLDTEDLVGAAPGPYAKNWEQFIRARHFLIKERKHRVNKKYVTGCPDNFMHGRTEIIPLSAAPGLVASCFREPFSASFSKAPALKKNKLDEDFPSLGSRPVASKVPVSNLEKRAIIFVGHDPRNDVDYLRTLGYNVLNLSNLIDTIDTAVIFKPYSRTYNSASLGTILSNLGIEGRYLHNAGNDAFHTLQAMLAICVDDAYKHAEVSDEVYRAQMQHEWEEESKEREKLIGELGKEVVEEMVKANSLPKVGECWEEKLMWG